MAQSYVQIPPDSTGKKIDTVTTTTAAQHRHVHCTGDPSTDAAIASVLSADPASNAYGGTVRDVHTPNIDTAIGAKTDAKATDSSSSWSVVALLKGIVDKLLATLAVTQSGTWTVQPGNTANTTAWKVDGSAVTQPVSGTFWQATQPVSGTIQIGATTSGGYSNSSINAAASNNATAVKGSAGQVYGVHVFNNAAYPIYVKLYNKATAPAPGTDNALLIRRIGVEAGTQRDVLFAAGLPFSTGIAIAIVKGITDTDNTSVAANDCVVETEYA